MNRRRIIILSCVLVVGVGAVLMEFSRHTSSAPKKATAKLSVPRKALDIGTVWEDEHFSWTVPVENQEAGLIEVESFSTTCNCLSIEPQSFVLGPGERRELRLTMNLLSQKKPSGDVAVKFTPRLKPGAGPAKRGPEWTVRGQVRRVMKFEQSIYLGRHSELSQSIPPRTVAIETLVPLESVSAQCDIPGITASVQLAPKEGDKAMLRLVPTPSLPAGAFEGKVTLKPVLKGDQSLPAQSLRFYGKIVPDIEADPPGIQVGGRRLGEMFEDVVVLRSLTGKTLGDTRIKVEGDGLSVDAAEGKGCYRVRQKVCGVGLQKNRVIILSESAGRQVTLTIPVSYTGVKDK